MFAMNTETKHNLIFLVIALAVMTPGFVMLFKKKMEPGAKPITMRDPVRKVAAYVDPIELPDTMARVVPDAAARWVRTLTPAGANPTVRTETERSPQQPWVSKSRKFELIVLGTHPQGTQATILVWDSKASAQDGNFSTYWDLPGRKVDGSMKRVERLTVPEDVVKAFLELGYNKPSREVTMIQVVYPVDLADVRTSALIMEYVTPEGGWKDTLSVVEKAPTKRPSMVTGN